MERKRFVRASTQRAASRQRLVSAPRRGRYANGKRLNNKAVRNRKTQGESPPGFQARPRRGATLRFEMRRPRTGADDHNANPPPRSIQGGIAGDRSTQSRRALFASQSRDFPRRAPLRGFRSFDCRPHSPNVRRRLQRRCSGAPVRRETWGENATPGARGFTLAPFLKQLLNCFARSRLSEPPLR
jgi:hypothetical protein